jgi:hypothetical protein
MRATATFFFAFQGADTKRCRFSAGPIWRPGNRTARGYKSYLNFQNINEFGFFDTDKIHFFSQNKPFRFLSDPNEFR